MNILYKYWFLGFIFVNVCIMISKYVLKGRLKRIILALVMIGYLIILQKLNKHNFALSVETQYSYIKHTNMYYDP